MRANLKDEDVAAKLLELKRRGRVRVTAGELARIFSVDSVRALGAMSRVERRVQGTRTQRDRRPS